MDDSANKLQYLIDILDITPSAFADNIGEKRPTGVYNVLKGTYRMSPELAKKIVAAYENVNIDWLLRNKGEALKWGNLPELGEKRKIEMSAKNGQIAPGSVEQLLQRIEELQEDKRRLQVWIEDIRAVAEERKKDKEETQKVIDRLLADKQSLIEELNALKNRDNDEVKSRVC